MSNQAKTVDFYLTFRGLAIDTEQKQKLFGPQRRTYNLPALLMCTNLRNPQAGHVYIFWFLYTLISGTTEPKKCTGYTLLTLRQFDTEVNLSFAYVDVVEPSEGEYGHGAVD